jgi:hypothetical protein
VPLINPFHECLPTLPLGGMAKPADRIPDFPAWLRL